MSTICLPVTWLKYFNQKLSQKKHWKQGSLTPSTDLLLKWSALVKPVCSQNINRECNSPTGLDSFSRPNTNNLGFLSRPCSISPI